VEQNRFDALTKRLAGVDSRRGVLGRIGRVVGAAVVAGVGIGRGGSDIGAQILPCAEDGCRCRASVSGSCVAGLVCCPDDMSLPGGSGTCVPPSQCFGGICSADAVACPAFCAWGAHCVGCCSGFCGANGACGSCGCRSAGCECVTGTLNPCDEGLACCPTFEGILGGPGICAPRGICG
jgi:hypothetical protein